MDIVSTGFEYNLLVQLTIIYGWSRTIPLWEMEGGTLVTGLEEAHASCLLLMIVIASHRTSSFPLPMIQKKVGFLLQFEGYLDVS